MGGWRTFFRPSYVLAISSVVYGFQILIQLGCKYLKAGALQYKITKSGAIPLIASEIGTDCVPYLNDRPMG